MGNGERDLFRGRGSACGCQCTIWAKQCIDDFRIFLIHTDMRFQNQKTVTVITDPCTCNHTVCAMPGIIKMVLPTHQQLHRAIQTAKHSKVAEMWRDCLIQSIIQQYNQICHAGFWAC